VMTVIEGLGFAWSRNGGSWPWAWISELPLRSGMGIATQRSFVPDNDRHGEIWEFW
jgi:hypothetical protein